MIETSSTQYAIVESVPKGKINQLRRMVIILFKHDIKYNTQALRSRSLFSTLRGTCLFFGERDQRPRTCTLHAVDTPVLTSINDIYINAYF